MRSTILMVATALILPATAGAVLAPSEQGRAAYSRFKALDTDMDRAVSRAELLRQGRERAADTLFALLDSDGDGRLSVNEVEAAGSGPRLARFQAYDLNQDGMVARREFPAFFDPLLFAALDGDGDGALELRDVSPRFAGWRPTPPASQPSAPDRPRRDGERPVCWVPNFGDADRWLIEVPVTSLGDGCRTIP